MQPLVIVLLSAMTWALLPGPAGADPVFDHLKCHSIRDASRFPAVVDLDALQPQFSAEGCRVGRAKLFCVPVAKALVQPPLAGPSLAGQSLSDDYICYRTKCPTRPGDEEVADQFGRHALSRLRTSLLCLPARKLATRCGPDLTCDASTEICVQREPVGPAVVHECRPVPTGCEADRSCRCTGSSLCQPPFDACTDAGWNTVSCECLACQ